MNNAILFTTFVANFHVSFYTGVYDLPGKPWIKNGVMKYDLYGELKKMIDRQMRQKPRIIFCEFEIIFLHYIHLMKSCSLRENG
jgi:hypothetical protein